MAFSFFQPRVEQDSKEFVEVISEIADYVESHSSEFAAGGAVLIIGIAACKYIGDAVDGFLNALSFRENFNVNERPAENRTQEIRDRMRPGG